MSSEHELVPLTSTSILAALRGVCAKLYPEESSARVVVADAGLNEQQIAFSSRAETNWHNILAEAIRCHRLDALLDIVQSTYPTNQLLQTAIITYQRFLEAGGQLDVPAQLPTGTTIYADQIQGDKVIGDKTSVGNISQSIGVAIGPGATAFVTITEESAYNVHDPNPYLGLRAFSYKDRAIYAGREQLAQETIQRLTKPGAQQTILFITGASGSGKSSFAQAGLIPLLEHHYAAYHKTVRHAIFRPSSHPMVMLVDALQKLHPDLTPETLATKTPQDQINLLLIDQFEELFIQSDASQRSPFCDFLTNLPGFAEGRTHVLVTLRVDYLDELFAIQPLWAIAKEGVELRKMQADDLRNAIQKPLQVNYPQKRFAPELLDRLLQDAGEDAALLPLLQVTLAELWKTGKLVLSNYHSLTNAIRQRAETIYAFSDHASADPKTPRSTAEQQELMGILLDLINVSVDGDDRRDVRQRRTRNELEQESMQRPRLIEELVNARLLAAASETRNGEDVEVIDIIHESLIDNWDRLRQAIEEQRQQLQRRARFKLWLGEWVRNGRQNGYLLLTDIQLAEARVLVEGRDIEVQSAEAYEFYQRSLAQQEAESQKELKRVNELAESQRRRAQTFRWAAVIATILTILALVATGFAVENLNVAQEQRETAQAASTTAIEQQITALAEKERADENAVNAKSAQSDAEQQAAIARSRQFVTQSASELDRYNYELAVLLAIESGISSDKPESIIPESFDSIRAAIANPWHSRAVFYGHIKKIDPTQTITSFAQWSHDENKILVSSSDGVVRILDGANGKQLFILEGQTGSISVVQWSHDDNKILTTCGDQTICLWDITSSRPLFRLEGHTGHVNSVQWSHDDKKILTASDDHTARIWDATSGEQLFMFEGHAGGVNSAQWSQDQSKILTASDDGTVRIWNVASREQSITYEGHSAGVNLAQWNQDESKILTTSNDGTVHILDVASGNRLLLLAEKGKIIEASWHYDNSKILTISDYGTANIWDALSGTLLSTTDTNATFQTDDISVTADGQVIPIIKGILDGEQRTQLNVNVAQITLLQGIEDGEKVLSGDNWGEIYIWDTGSGKPLGMFKGHEGRVTSAQWSQNTGKILTSDEYGTIRIWDRNIGSEAPTFKTFGVYGMPIALWKQNDNKILSGNRIFDVNSGKQITSFEGLTGTISFAQWSHDKGKILADSEDNVSIWDAATGRQLSTLTGYKSDVSDAQWSYDDSKILTSSKGDSVLIWDAASGEQLSVLHNTTFAQWSQDGSKFLTISDNGTGQILDAKTGQQLVTLKRLLGKVQYAQWSQDETKILTQSSDNVYIWDVASGNKLFMHDLVSSVAWSQDETKILFGTSEGIAYIWDTNSSDQMMIFKGHTGNITSVQWSQDERRVLTGSDDDTARVWDAESGDELRKLEHNSKGVISAQWSNDDSKVLTVGDTVRIWDSNTGKELFLLPGVTSLVTDAQWSADNSKILVVSSDGFQRIWYLSSSPLIEAACSDWAPRNMNWREWQNYIDIPYRPTCPNKPIPPDVIEGFQEEARQQILSGQVVSATQRLEELNSWLQVNRQFTNYNVDVSAFVAEVSASATAEAQPAQKPSP